MLPVERRLLIKVANMYYIDEMKQSDIAEKLGVNRTTVSKYLKRAMQSGIVKISIVNESHELLEKQLEGRFGLKEVYIVDSSPDDDEVRNSLGRAGMSFLKRVVKDKDIVGFAWGRTMAAIVDNASIEKITMNKVKLIPLVGGPENVASQYHVNSIITKLADEFKETSYCLYAPAICQTAEIKDSVIQNINYKKIAEMWEKLNVAFVGIGAPVKNSNVVWMGDFGDESIEELAKAGVVGEICSVFYDINGQVVETSLSDKTIAINLEKLRSINYSIGVAASTEKVKAIYGALKGGLINVLITDEATAKALAEYKADV
jgi:DNA-binding transcriptional regulator LsrR (DeoR family)